jgi:RHS repeat-associated protein
MNQSQTLDGLGNFSTFDDDGDEQTRTVNAANEITDIDGAAGWVSPEYDAAGNIIFAPKSGDETTGLHFVRDAWNRQVAVYEDDGDGVYEPGTDDSLIAEYEFDGANRRIEKTLADGTTTEFYYNRQWQLLEEVETPASYPTSPASITQYVWSPRYIDAPIVRFHDGNGDGDLFDAGDTTLYYTGDANFNVTATIDAATGDVVNRYAYSAYGEATVYEDDWDVVGVPAEDGPLYCGYFFDAETGNSRVRTREYITCLSTFDIPDPIKYKSKDFNLYRYGRRKGIRNQEPLFCPFVTTGRGLMLHETLQHIGRRWAVGVRLHRASGAALAQAAHGARVTEQIGQRGMGIDHRVAPPGVRADDDCSALLQVAHDVADVFVGHGHFEPHDGFQQNDARLAEPFLKGIACRIAEGQLVRARFMDLAAEDRDPHMHQREAQRAAAFALFGEHFDGRGQKLLGQLDVGTDGDDDRFRPHPLPVSQWERGVLFAEWFHPDAELGREHLPGDVAMALARDFDRPLDGLAITNARFVDADVQLKVS